MITLRDADGSDRDRLFAWRNLPDVRRWMYTDHEITREEHDAWFDAMLGDTTRKYWIINLDGMPVGVANLAEINLAHSRSSWAFYLGDKRTRGRGVGAATELLVLEYVFRELGLDRLYCEVLANNLDVIGLHQSFGFVEEGRLRNHITKAGEQIDVVLLGLLANEWELRRNDSLSRLRSRGAIR